MSDSTGKRRRGEGNRLSELHQRASLAARGKEMTLAELAQRSAHGNTFVWYRPTTAALRAAINARPHLHCLRIVPDPRCPIQLRPFPAPVACRAGLPQHGLGIKNGDGAGVAAPLEEEGGGARARALPVRVGATSATDDPLAYNGANPIPPPPPSSAHWQVWVCLAEPSLSAACGGGGNSSGILGGGGGGGRSSGDLVCHVFNELILRFAFWGRNSDLRLVS